MHGSLDDASWIARNPVYQRCHPDIEAKQITEPGADEAPSHTNRSYGMSSPPRAEARGISLSL